MSVNAKYVPMLGGLDLESPPGMVEGGRASTMINFEVSVTGGYRRVDGYERLDGRSAPHLGNPVGYGEPWDLTQYMGIEGDGGVIEYPKSVYGERNVEPAVLKIPLQDIDLSLGQTFDYDNQLALYIHDNPIAHYVVGEFATEADLLAAIEALPGVVSATVDDVASELIITSEIEPAEYTDPSLHILAADFQRYGEDTTEQRREAIQPPPGDGPIRGLVVFNGRVICARDQDTGGYLYVSSQTGWKGLTLPNPRDAGGDYYFAIGNFTGDPGEESVFVVDGVNPPLQIKDKSLEVVEITAANVDVGVDTLYPQRVAVHKGHLFVSYEGGSLQHSAIGDPYSWDSTGGAGEIAVGKAIHDIKPLKGDALGVFTEDGIEVLYGSSSADWTIEGMGRAIQGVDPIPRTVGYLGSVLFADRMGIRELGTMDAYGNFASTTLTQSVRTLYDRICQAAPWTPTFSNPIPTGERQELSIRCATVIPSKSQYLLLASGGEVLIMTTTGQQLLGFGYAKLGFVPTCASYGVDPLGKDFVVVGGEDGHVYRLGVGSSFDGQPINATLRLHYNHMGAPRNRKRFRKAILDVQSPAPFTLYGQAAFDYSNSDAAQHVEQSEGVIGTDGQWMVDNWGEFQWGGNDLTQPEITITGSGRAMALMLHCSGTQIPPFQVDGVTLHYSRRRIER